MSAANAVGLKVSTDYDGSSAVVTVAGEVDVYSAAVLRDRLTALAAAGHHRIALDLNAMTFCDSSGLGVMVGAVKRAGAGDGGVALFGSPQHFLRVLRITGLSKVMPAFEGRAEALGWLSAQ